MKPIEDIDLIKVVEEAKKQRIESLSESVRDKIRHILSKNSEIVGSIADYEARLAKAKERLKKAQEKLEKIEKGDWSIIEDDENKDKTQSNESL